MDKRLTNRNILLGITGGIAAYKSAELLRKLQERGAEVRVVMTPAAEEFVTPLTLQALSGKPVHRQLLDPEAEAGMGHIELARWADLVLVAPASADFMARLAQGLGNDLLTTLCLATPSPVAIAPAMNQGMWRDAATQDNLRTLGERNIAIYGPADGEQACGDVGPGRMLEPEQIAEAVCSRFTSRALEGKHVVITAGPTREALDPVRYLSNHSSGKMGFALAAAAADAGAAVTLVAGPVHLPAPERVTRVDVVSARDMLSAVEAHLDTADIFIGCAAVADYRPAEAADQKIKKRDEDFVLTMVPNPDIIATLAQRPKPPFTVGFAAETEAVANHAQGKLARKKLNMIVANDVGRQDIGFGSEDNAVTVYWGNGQQEFSAMRKTLLATELIALIAQRFGAHTG